MTANICLQLLMSVLIVNIFAPAHTDAYVDFGTAMKQMNREKTEAPKSDSESKIHNSDVLSFLNTLVMENQNICPFQDKYTEHIVQCPSTSPLGIADKVCITTSELCNGRKSCPNAEDENPALCMFWLSTMDYVRQFSRTITSIMEPMIAGGDIVSSDPRFTHGLINVSWQRPREKFDQSRIWQH
ncbi:hypothetical protein T05_11567 [Trichinella murrelli]|uniref:Uncharacterized protein n=1 Tax=Trichinella murrelli TaxID=144512 RepID=A0A0V0TVJ6_9BILA|nr:hypothetical protein T05_11567 [Trichinella murrelli]